MGDRRRGARPIARLVRQHIGLRRYSRRPIRPQPGSERRVCRLFAANRQRRYAAQPALRQERRGGDHAGAQPTEYDQQLFERRGGTEPPDVPNPRTDLYARRELRKAAAADVSARDAVSLYGRRRAQWKNSCDAGAPLPGLAGPRRRARLRRAIYAQLRDSELGRHRDRNVASRHTDSEILLLARPGAICAPDLRGLENTSSLLPPARQPPALPNGADRVRRAGLGARLSHLSDGDG